MSVFAANTLSANISDQNFYALRSNNNGGNPLRHQPPLNRRVLEDYFSCPLCSSVFTNIVDLRRHEMEHAGNDVIKLFKGKLALESPFLMKKVDDAQNNNAGHSSTDHSRSQLDSAFTEKYKTLMVKESSKAFHCTLCSDIYTIRSNLEKHMKFYHNVDDTFTCEVCGIMYAEELSYLRHCETHTNKDRLNETHKNKNRLYDIHTNENRLYDIHTNENRLYDETHTNKNRLYNTHTDSDDKRRNFECRFCCKHFSSRESLKVHVVEHRRDVTPPEYRRKENNFTTTTIRPSSKIQEKNEDKGGIPYQRSDENQNNLCKQDIVNRHHNTTKPGVFGNNNQRLIKKPGIIRQQNFKKNLMKNDTVEEQDDSEQQMKVNCHVCNEIFASKSLMMEHQHLHRDSKQYICHNCGEIFWRKRRLIRHETMHCAVLKALDPNDMQESNAPYQCETCHQEFWRKRYYTRHKIYNCDKDVLINDDGLGSKRFDKCF